jgi:hypothetical protein
MTDAEFLAHLEAEMGALAQLMREVNIDETALAEFRKRYEKLRAKLDKMLARGISDETKAGALAWLSGLRASLFDRRPHNRS